jgi:Zn-finger nucleic acid-binding protein
MKCPRDHAELTEKIYESDITVDACPECGGLWLEKGKLEAIEESLDNDYTPELKEMPNLIEGAFERAEQMTARSLTCPACGSPMENHEYAYCSQVMVDSCPHCGGIWLDEGEIMKLELFFERSRIEAGAIRRGFWGSLNRMFGRR